MCKIYYLILDKESGGTSRNCT